MRIRGLNEMKKLPHQKRRLAFALFATSILFSLVREWVAPIKRGNFSPHSIGRMQQMSESCSESFLVELICGRLEKNLDAARCPDGNAGSEEVRVFSPDPAPESDGARYHRPIVLVAAT